ncbi:MAG: hypothetical protein IJ342_00250 [Muribaculaceae bacterium]|nr:hypothetical protein [Muribaculaceae bacterium]
MVIKSKEVLQGLSTKKLKSYIFFLTQKYIVSYVQNDRAGYELAIEQLFFIVEEYGDKYVNLDGFICFCLCVHSCEQLKEFHGNKQVFALEPLFKMDLLEDDVEELPFDIKNIFNKERIRERYNEKRTCEHVEKA